MFQKKRNWVKCLLLCCCFTLAMGVMTVSAADVKYGPGYDTFTFGIFEVYNNGVEVFKPEEIQAGSLEIRYGFVKVTEADQNKNVDIYATLYDEADNLRYVDKCNATVQGVTTVDLPIKLEGLDIAQADAGKIGRLTVFVWEHDSITPVVEAYDLGHALIDYDMAGGTLNPGKDGFGWSGYTVAAAFDRNTLARDDRGGGVKVEATDSGRFKEWYDAHPDCHSLGNNKANGDWIYYRLGDFKPKYMEITALGYGDNNNAGWRDVDGKPNTFTSLRKLNFGVIQPDGEDPEWVSLPVYEYTGDLATSSAGIQRFDDPYDPEHDGDWFIAKLRVTAEPGTYDATRISLEFTTSPAYTEWAMHTVGDEAPDNAIYGNARILKVAFY